MGRTRLVWVLGAGFDRAASVSMKIEMDARNTSSFDPVYLNNEVSEFLDEADIRHTTAPATE